MEFLQIISYSSYFGIWKWTHRENENTCIQSSNFTYRNNENGGITQKIMIFNIIKSPHLNIKISGVNLKKIHQKVKQTSININYNFYLYHLMVFFGESYSTIEIYAFLNIPITIVMILKKQSKRSFWLSGTTIECFPSTHTFTPLYIFSNTFTSSFPYDVN